MLLALLAGCDGANAPSTVQEADSTQVTQAFQRNGIVLKDGDVLPIEGQIVRYELIRKGKDVTERYVVESSKSLMELESLTFADLARRGYVRQVRNDTPERFQVTYRGKGLPLITADYRAQKNVKDLARVIFNVRTGG